MIKYKQTPKKFCCSVLIGGAIGFLSTFGYFSSQMYNETYKPETEKMTPFEKTKGLTGIVLSSTLLGLGGGLFGSICGGTCGKIIDKIEEKEKSVG